MSANFGWQQSLITRGAQEDKDLTYYVTSNTMKSASLKHSQQPQLNTTEAECNEWEAAPDIILVISQHINVNCHYVIMSDSDNCLFYHIYF